MSYLELLGVHIKNVISTQEISISEDIVDEKSFCNKFKYDLNNIFSSSLNETLNEFCGKNFSDFKKKLSDLVVDKISPISQKMEEIQKDNKFIDDILKQGAEKANKIASKKVDEIKKIFGF